MLERVKQVVTKHKTALLVLLCLLIVCVAYAVGRHAASDQAATEKPAVMTQEQVENMERLQYQLDISRANAQDLHRRIAAAQAGPGRGRRERAGGA